MTRPDGGAAVPGPVLVARIALGAALLAGGGYVAALLLLDPVVWPDEALFSSPAINLLRHGHLGTDVMAPYLPGIATRTYWTLSLIHISEPTRPY